MAAVSPEEKREKVRGIYHNGTWSEKVDKMTDAQIHMIYMRKFITTGGVASKKGI